VDRKREWLTVREAADLVGVDYKAIQRACQRGVLGAERLGSVWLIPRRNIEAARKTIRPELERRTRKGTPRRARQHFLRGATSTSSLNSQST
jgi:excisionase family DNA binding protein